ncbi:hypothetical protein DV737_g3775, partial [Chaetothyriales sp. CBS 132003]
MATVQFVTTDVFTQTPYLGNPLAIVRLPASIKLSQAQKQAIAREFNLSETVILHESEEALAKSEWTADIFITTAEIPLAGHPLIGTSCYLGRTLQPAAASATVKGTLNTKAGAVGFEYNSATGSAAASIPHNVHIHDRKFGPEHGLAHDLHPHVAKAIVKPAPFVSIVPGMTFCLVEVPDLDTLGKVRTPLKEVCGQGLNRDFFHDGFVGFFFYCRQGERDGVIHLRTRMISGTEEDPATGSASSALAVFLALTEVKQPVQRFALTQAVEIGRQSDIGVEVTLDGSASRVDKVVLSGSAVAITHGSIVIPPVGSAKQALQ